MTYQTLEEQLVELRLSTFRNALREQRENPKYNDLPFEDRLSMLVEAEYIQRRENRIARNIRLAKFPMQAALEDVDFAPGRGLERRYILELGQSEWIARRQNLLIL
jgi:DNA replication protein DnaC